MTEQGRDTARNHLLLPLALRRGAGEPRRPIAARSAWLGASLAAALAR